ncbi:hypothetical protein MKX03_011495 [Papaver bracteatum]|nr:hypothetical protein MKX03_011495 [Papaver bracteatum]
MVPTRRRKIKSEWEIQFELGLAFWGNLFLFSGIGGVECQCSGGCDLALASYNAWVDSNLTFISQVFGTTDQDILKYNPQVTNKDLIVAEERLNVPFKCDCIYGQRLYLMRDNDYKNLSSILDGSPVKVRVNCSRGDEKVSDYGLFLSYPLLPRDTLSSIANQSNISSDLLGSYNPNTISAAGWDWCLFLGENVTCVKLSSPRGLRAGAIVGIAVGIVAFALLLAVCSYIGLSRRKKALMASETSEGITVDKSVEFMYEELARATDDFSMANKIGQGDFGAVYYAELRGEKAAIKKMDMQASKEFHAELKVLTRVHHLNLVRLIGYCVEGSLFLVYEFIDSGNLSEHLRGTVPVYIHRDIKSANILVDKNFHGKWGDITPKVDVYAFGVVLYELISAKAAVVRSNGSSFELRGLVYMFEEVPNQPESNEDLRKLVDPTLGDNYPLDSVLKNPQSRPSMRSIVVALMTLSSATEDWDVGSFYENHGLVNLMSRKVITETTS